jgi:hypothetical protein
MEKVRLKALMRQTIHNIKKSYDYNQSSLMMEICPFKKLVSLSRRVPNSLQFLKVVSKVSFLKFYQKYKMTAYLMRNSGNSKKKNIKAFNFRNKF